MTLCVGFWSTINLKTPPYKKGFPKYARVELSLVFLFEHTYALTLQLLSSKPEH